MIPTLFGMSIIAFLIIQLPPGDYLTSMIASMADAGAERRSGADRAAARDLRPRRSDLWSSTGSGSAASSSAAISATRSSGTGRSGDLIWERMGSTLSSSLAGARCFVWAVALPIGIYSAVRRHSVGDYVFTFLGFLGLAIPNFILALTLMYVAYTLPRAERRRAVLAANTSDAPWSWAKSSTCWRISGSRSSSSAPTAPRR